MVCWLPPMLIRCTLDAEFRVNCWSQALADIWNGCCEGVIFFLLRCAGDKSWLELFSEELSRA